MNCFDSSLVVDKNSSYDFVGHVELKSSCKKGGGCTPFKATQNKCSRILYVEIGKDYFNVYDLDKKDVAKINALVLKSNAPFVVGMVSVEDYPIVVEDVKFLHQCFKTTLKDYWQFFQERIIEGKSIRKYAEDHNINRGSVEYQQKRLIVALSNLLFDRDAAEGVLRVDYSWLKQ